MKTNTFKFVCIAVALFVVQCSIKRGQQYQEVIKLPTTATIEQAQTIGQQALTGGIFDSVVHKYPVLKDLNNYGLFLKWMTLIPSSGKNEVVILVGVKYRKELENAKEIAGYEKELVDKYVTKYYKAEH